MQGYIIHIVPQKNEDIIVYILTSHKIKKLYRFYGARHSTIQLGKKIDFETEQNGVFLPKLRNITPINFKFEQNLERLYIWQRYSQLLHRHFLDIQDIDSFYFDCLDFGASKINYQNPMRVIIEMYIKLLNHEGRIPQLSHCFICSKPLDHQISLARAFLPAHTSCLNFNHHFNLQEIISLLKTHSSIHLDDQNILKLYKIIELGI